MKRDQLQKLKEKNSEDLKKELQIINDRLWQLKVDLASGKVKNVREIRQLKRKVAIINTFLKNNNK